MTDLRLNIIRTPQLKEFDFKSKILNKKKKKKHSYRASIWCVCIFFFFCFFLLIRKGEIRFHSGELTDSRPRR